MWSGAWRAALVAAAAAVLLTSVSAAANEAPPDVTTSTTVDVAPTTHPTTTVATSSTTTTSVPPTPAGGGTTAPPEAPASATPPPPAPEPVVGALEPAPDTAPVPVALATTAADLSGALGAAEGAVTLARSRTTSLEARVEQSSAALTEALAALDTEASSAAEAEDHASGEREQADVAHRAAIAAATDSLLSSRTTPHPSTQLALHGELDPDELWEYGFRQALAEPVGARVELSRSEAARARRRASSAAAALEAAQDRVDSLTGTVAAVRAELDQARAAQVEAETGLAAAQGRAAAAWGADVSIPDAQRVTVLDIPTRTLDAYLLAERRLAVEAPACRMRWWVVAGIGAVESGHGTYRGAYPGADGVVRPLIIGPRLDGGAFARIGDTDGGRLDGDTEYDRAVGPMQFIPSTWASSGGDGNGDGVSDPHNVYDAAYAAANYLCRGARGVPVDTAAGFAAAAWSYNRSRPYGATTWQRAVAYSSVAPRVDGGLSSAP